MDLQTIIAKNILHLLDQGKSTQSELSAYLNISRQTLSNYLKGTSTMDCVKLVQTAEFFHVPVTSLLTDSRMSQTTMLFRSALNYQDAVNDIEPLVKAYISRYEDLIKISGNISCFLPEQHSTPRTTVSRSVSRYIRTAWHARSDPPQRAGCSRQAPQACVS